MSYQALNLANQIRLLGGVPLIPQIRKRPRKELIQMGGVLLFIAGMIVGGVMGIFCLCLVQINGISI
jgi:hypothetical protein